MGFNRFNLGLAMVLTVFNLRICWSINSEGLALLRFRERVVRDPFGALSNWNNYEGEIDPCSWFGVECSDGKVVILNLKDLCLEGTLAPELGKLPYINSIILRNNSFSGNIPVEIGVLKELEVLDLGFNNFSGPYPSDLGNNLSLSILLLDHNNFIGSLSPEIYDLEMLSESQVDVSQLSDAASWATCNCRSSTWNTEQPRDIAQRRLLQNVNITEPGSNTNKTNNSMPSPPPSLSPETSATSDPSAPSPPSSISPEPSVTSDPSAPSLSPILPPKPAKPNHHRRLILYLVIGGSVFMFISVLGIVFYRMNKVVTVGPWATTGLSGQLQKAFVTGVPKLQLSELETACEDFSNIIGSLSDGTVYKGTLSSGVEIAVKSTAVESVEDWTKNLEAQFREKIETLSRVNHKNFVNLIGFCEEDEPFTRIMVFEYAPNGTLFEHLHLKEAEHLDWAMRLRIAMGMAYCLEHMHQLNPPISHANLQSTSIYLTEDYAAKISDFSFWKIGSASMEVSETPSTDLESNIYSFGVILFEIITGRLPYCEDSGSFSDWASDYLLGSAQSVREIVDPTLQSFQEEEIMKLFEVVKDCVRSDPNTRPTMGEVARRLKEITDMGPEGVAPKLSPLWWAELEILSTEAT